MKIKKLARQEAQKIAAGEVVERPANIVKELIENSLDAGARHIMLSVKQGGKKYIRIVDNGGGMSPEDAKICFERHTTSKIKTIDQLQNINTFGFRGEALASICSVAKVTITTKQKDTLEGLELSLENGAIEKTKIVGTQTGTTITITDLFYNVPARKKFLKATTTEWNHVVTLFKAFALDNLAVHFILEHDDATVYNCPPVQQITERITQLFQEPLTNHVASLTTFEKDDITISGALTTQQYARYDRGGIFFFVNNRWVKNYRLISALTKGYLNVLPSGRYPAAAIAITVNPKTVDINVHPKKEEIQFLNPRLVESAITAAVKTTLENQLSKHLKRTVNLAPEPVAPFSSDPFPLPFTPTPLQKEEKKEPKIQNIPFPQKEEQPQQQEVPKEENKQIAASKNYTLLSQYKKTYLLLEKEEGLFIVDQHAAHERILYERFADRFNQVAVVRLLFPHSITLSTGDIDLLEPHLELFHKYGIEIERSGKDQLAVKATPVFFKNQPINDLITQTIGWVKELGALDPQDFYKKITEKLRAQMACKAAVKAGDVLTTKTMEQLLDDLETTNNRFTCPHGRPTSWMFSLNDLERKFKRKL